MSAAKEELQMEWDLSRSRLPPFWRYALSYSVSCAFLSQNRQILIIKAQSHLPLLQLPFCLTLSHLNTRIAVIPISQRYKLVRLSS
jgi:branched-subunit amino acid transport protein